MELKTEIKRFLDTLDRSPRTIFTYHNALEQFINSVGEDAELSTETYTAFLTAIKSKSPSTKRVYTTAVRKFFAFCKAGNWFEMKEATDHYTRNQGKRIVFIGSNLDAESFRGPNTRVIDAKGTTRMGCLGGASLSLLLVLWCAKMLAAKVLAAKLPAVPNCQNARGCLV